MKKKNMKSHLIATGLFLTTTTSLACQTAAWDNEESSSPKGGTEHQARIRHVPRDGGFAWLETNRWQLPRDFTTSAPPAGVTPDWRFGWKNTANGIFEPFTSTGTSIPPRGGVPLVYFTSPANQANAWKNPYPEDKHGIRPGQVSLHPGDGGQYATARWVASRPMRASVWAQFGKGDEGAMGYRVVHNTASGSSNALWISPPANITAEYFGKLDLQAGDSLDFMVGESFTCGNTPVTVDILELTGGDYSATTSFDNHWNGRGGFAYGWRQTPTSFFFTYYNSSDNPWGWMEGTSSGPNINGPKAWRSLSDNDPMLPSKAIALFPGNGSEYSSMVFSVPFSGIHFLDVTVFRGTGDWCNVEYVIKLNGTIMARSEVSDGTVTKAFYGDIRLHEGDTIEVLIGNSVPGTGRSAGAAGVEFHLRAQ